MGSGFTSLRSAPSHRPGHRGAGLVNLGVYAERMQAAAPAATVSHSILSAALPGEGIIACVGSFGPDLLMMERTAPGPWAACCWGVLRSK
jgi:hypothetical protein